jgi:polyhydroxyalkanoate synthesis regulator phasin
MPMARCLAGTRVAGSRERPGSKSMSKKTDAAVDRVSTLIDELSAPKAMTEEEAREFYGDLIDNLQVKLDCLKSDD